MYAHRIVSADLDGDGEPELIFAQPGFDSFGELSFGERGRLHRWTASGNTYAPSEILTGPVSFASVLAVSAPEERRVFVVRGATGQPWTILDAGLRASAIIELDVTTLGTLPGWSLAAVGDLDGDGRDEQLVSGVWEPLWSGSVSRCTPTTRRSPRLSIPASSNSTPIASTAR